MTAWSQLATALVAAVSVGITVWTLRLRQRTQPSHFVKLGASDAAVRLLQKGRRKMLSNLLDVGGFFGIDMGGSLTKVVVFLPDDELADRTLELARKRGIPTSDWEAKLARIHSVANFFMSRTTYGMTGVRDAHLSFHMRELGGAFHFIRFETRRMEGAMRLVQQHRIHETMKTICTTGGGSFAPLAKRILGIDLGQRDEIDCLVKGLAFLTGYVSSEAYTFHGKRLVDRPMETVQYPYLLVNIGSGVGFILVRSEHDWQRVSGTSLGGGTYYGLCHMLTGCSSFDEMLDMAEEGNNANVDLTVGDIYGGDYGKFGLKSGTIASSFGKAITWGSSSSSSGSGKVGSGQAASGGPVPLRDPLASITPTDTAAHARSLSADHVYDLERTATLLSESVTLSSDRADASFARTVRRIQADAGSFGAHLIGGHGPRRSIATANVPPTSGFLSTTLSHEGSDSASSVSDEEKGKSPTAAVASVAGGASPLVSIPSAVTDVSPVDVKDFSASASVHTIGSSMPPDAKLLNRARSCTDGAMPSVQPAAGAGVAAFFAAEGADAKDISRSLLIMLSNNIGQLAYLNAVQFNCRHVYFAGNFLRHENTIAMRTLAYAINFWSRGVMEGLFLRHEGYCGAVGAFLSTLETVEDVDF